MIGEIIANATWLAPYAGALLTLALSLGRRRIRGYVGASVLLISALSSTFLLRSVLGSSEGFVHYAHTWVPGVGVDLGIYVDTLSAFMAFVVAWLSFLIGFYSLKYMEGDPGLARYWFFFSFFVGSMMLLILAENLILMFLGWEGTGLASYALIGHWHTDPEEKWVGDHGRKALGISMRFSPSHGGLRAIVFTRLGDVGFLAGIAVIYALTGTFSIPAMAHGVGGWAGTLATKGLLLPFLLTFSLGAMAKSAQFPFHEWLVTAMTGPTSVSALIHAATMVKAGVFFMLRFAPIFHLASIELSSTIPSAVGDVNTFFAVIATIGAFTAFFMATQAIVASELKLVLAFSTASQLGYMFLAIGSSGLTHEFTGGFLACFNHLMSHAVFKASLFLAAGAIIHVVESRYLRDMGGLSRHMRGTFPSMLLAALSLSGLPPMMGFWTKDSILEAAYGTGMLIPFALGVITAAITAFYSMRMIMRVFLREESKNVKHLAEEHEVHEAHRVMLAPYLLLALISLTVGLLWPLMAPGLNSSITRHVIALEHVPHEFKVHLDPMLTGLSVLMVLSGFGLAYITYIRPRINKRISAAVSSRTWVGGLRNLLYDRYYINSIYYQIFVRGAAKFSSATYKWFNILVIDGFYHRFLPWITNRARAAADIFNSVVVDGFYHGLIPRIAARASKVSSKFNSVVVDGFYHRLIPRATNAASNKTFRRFERGVIDKGFNVAVPNRALELARLFRKVQTGRINHYLLMFFLGLVIVAVIVVLVV